MNELDILTTYFEAEGPGGMCVDHTHLEADGISSDFVGLTMNGDDGTPLTVALLSGPAARQLAAAILNAADAVEGLE